MFIGEYRHNLDAKGRITIPAKFRELLEDKVIISKGFDGCLNIYTLPQWRLLLEGLNKLPNTKRESRKYKHMVTSKAAECEIDNQGRILLPNPLIQEAQISKECVLVGVADHAEIWAKERWEAYYEEASESFEDIAEQLTDFML